MPTSSLSGVSDGAGYAYLETSPPRDLRVPVLLALTGERLAELSASPDDTVGGLGRAAAEAAGLDANVRLVHRGRVLANSDTVAEAGIVDREELLAVASRRQRNIQSMIQVYERAERLNACFMVDCTGSMRPHIKAVKDQIHSIVAEMYARLPCLQLRLSFLGYRDIGDHTRFEILPFTTSVDEFQAFVAEVRATGGGGDGPEDVHGAVAQAAAMDWAVGDAATRVLIHIADHPAHGRRYNDSPRDHYPDGDPYGLDLAGLMEQIRAQDVQYVFGHITDHTRKMVRVLNEELGDYIDTKEMQDVGQVAEAVTSSLHASVASTVSTLSRGARSATAPVEFSAELPDWGTLPVEVIAVRSCLPVTCVEDLHPGADPSRTRMTTEVRATMQLAPLPFSQGESRLARHALMDGCPAVAKHFKCSVAEIVGDEEGDTSGQDDEGEEDPHLTLSEISAVAVFLAEVFSASRPEGANVSFIASDAGKSCADGAAFNIESVLPVAEFRRFSNNVGWWEPDTPEILMHFARWTHIATRGHMMVADLQGVCVSGGFLLTDPCVLCDDVTRFGSGNLGPYAIERSLTALARRLDPVPAHLPDPAKSVAVPANAWKPPVAAAGAAPAAKGAVALDVDGLIHQLLTAPRRGAPVQIAEGQIIALLVAARDAFLRQPSLLELDAPISIMGDIHGQFPDLLRFFDANGHPPDTNLLMLGDYVDRGRQSVEVICLLLAYKVKYPENVFLLRGNHECASITRIYGFYDECKRRYNIKLWKRFTDVFNCLPPAALISDKILCMHGGISPELTSFEQIRNLPRPCDVPDSGLLCDLLWSDPDKDISGYVENDRGVSFMFGPDALDSFNLRLGLNLVVRAHQVVEDGYEFFADRSLVTLFSAPNYCGEFDNAGGLMRIHDDLLCSFKLLEPAGRNKPVSGTSTGQLADA